MRTITHTVYRYDELSEDAQEKAREWWRGLGDTFAWGGEWRETLAAFCNQFPVEVRDWEVSTWRGSNISADICQGEEFNPEDMKGARAWKWLIANGYGRIRNSKGALVPVIGEEQGACSLTGYCADADILEPLALFLRRPDPRKSLADIFQDCLDAWAAAYQADMEYQEGDEYIAEALEINGCEFDENGRPV